MAKIAVHMFCSKKYYKAEIPTLKIIGEGSSRLEAMINLRKSLKKYIAECQKITIYRLFYSHTIS